MNELSESYYPIDINSDEYFMNEAIREAKKALRNDATAHAEMLALSSAQEYVGDWRLNECDLYVTKEPCAMCAGGIIHCRIRSVIFGCSSPKDGAAGGGYINLLNQPTLNHRSEIRSGVLADYSSKLLKEFFQSARSNSKKKNQ